MNRLRQQLQNSIRFRPFMFVGLGLMAGILFGEAQPTMDGRWAWLGFGAVLLWGLIWWLAPRRQEVIRFLVPGLLLPLCIGGSLGHRVRPDFPAGIENWLEKPLIAAFSITKLRTSEGGNCPYLEAELTAVKGKTHFAAPLKPVKVWVSCRTLPEKQIKVGSAMSAIVKLERLDSTLPSGFANYLHRQNIFLSAEVVRWKSVRNPADSWQRFQGYFRRKLAKAMPSDLERPIAQALLLGDRSELPRRTQEDYRAAGLAHLLALSGTHVSVLLLLFGGLQRLLQQLLRTRWLPPLVTLVLLWGFVLVTGASPSIVRAGLFTSLLVVPVLLRRDADLFNVLAFTLVVHLLFAPEALFDIGFQFSYAAVLGIFIWEPIFERAYRNLPTYGQYLIQLGSVSISATLGYALLQALHFQSFNSYFLLSNVAVTGLAFLVILIGFLLLVLHWVPEVSAFLGYLLEWGLWAMNRIAEYFASLPGATLEWEEGSTHPAWWVASFILLQGTGLAINASIRKTHERYRLPLQVR